MSKDYDPDVYRDTVNWKPWFAWKPVRISGRWRWLVKVERKQVILGFRQRTDIPPVVISSYREVRP
jgi:hypothetical protein